MWTRFICGAALSWFFLCLDLDWADTTYQQSYTVNAPGMVTVGFSGGSSVYYCSLYPNVHGEFTPVNFFAIIDPDGNTVANLSVISTVTGSLNGESGSLRLTGLATSVSITGTLDLGGAPIAYSTTAGSGNTAGTFSSGFESTSISGFLGGNEVFYPTISYSGTLRFYAAKAGTYRADFILQDTETELAESGMDAGTHTATGPMEGTVLGSGQIGIDSFSSASVSPPTGFLKVSKAASGAQGVSLQWQVTPPPE